MARKTIEIEKVKELVNDMLLHTPDKDTERRVGAFIVLEQLLHDTGNYQGYNHLTSQHMGESLNGKSIGIDIIACNAGDWENQFKDCDDTRRYYF